MTVLEDAHAALLAKKYRRALELYQAAAREDPRNPVVFEGLGRTLFELHRYDEALAECLKALELDATLPLPHVTLSYIYCRQGDLAAFKREALEARRLGPELPETLLCYGTVLLAENDVDDAIEVLQKAIQAAPKNRNAHYNLSLAWYRKGRMDQYLAEKQVVWQLQRSFRSFAELLLAYGIKHRTAAGVILASSLILAIIFNFPYLLLLPLLEATAIVLSGVLLIFWRQWRSGVLMLLYAAGLYILLYVIFAMFFK
jgi:tetratricopeptide (TPR) repeat protein